MCSSHGLVRRGWDARGALWRFCFAKSAALAERGPKHVLQLLCLRAVGLMQRANTLFDLRRTWTSARIRSMEHIDNGQKFCVRQSTWDTGFAGPEQKCLRRWSCVISPFDWRLGRMRDCISNGKVFHLFVATLLTQRGAVAETSSLSPTRSQRRRRLLARMWPQEWNLQCRWGVPDCRALVLQTR